MNWDDQKIKEKLSVIVLICFVFICVFLTLDTTELYSLIINEYVILAFSITAFLTFSTSLACFFLNIRIKIKSQCGPPTGKRNILIASSIKGLIILFTSVCWFVRGQSWRELLYLYMVLFVVAVEDTCVRRYLSYSFLAGAGMVLLCFFLSMLGIISNNRGNSFGFAYRTDYACHILCLTLLYCLLRNGYLSAKGELALLAITLIDWKIIGGKTALACLVLLCLVTFWRHFRQNEGVPFQDKSVYNIVLRILFQIIYIPIRILDWLTGAFFNPKRILKICKVMTFSYLIFSALTLALTWSYRFIPNKVLDLFSRFGSVISRMQLGTVGFENFHVRLFGNLISQAGNGGTEGPVYFYFFLDSSYVKILLEYGVILFVIMLGLMTWSQIRLYRAHRYYAVFLLVLFAMDCCMEHHLTDLSYNCFILLAFAKIDLPVEGVLIPSRLRGGRKKLPVKLRSTGQKVLRTGLIGLACLFALYWCVSAYKISTFSGWAPVKEVTVLLLGSYLDTLPSEKLNTARADMARKYLRFYKDAKCIISSNRQKNGVYEAEQIRDWLVDHGIDEDRIILDLESGSINEMLTNTAKLQEELSLPVRRAVCTFPMQQSRVNKHADKLHIPVGTIDAIMPWQFYLPCYLTEQCKLWL